MLIRFLLRLKISKLSCMVKVMEANIIKYRKDMDLMNNLYYCGRGDVDTYINEWTEGVRKRIEACKRLIVRFQRKLDGVVG
jgi:hypothetical protein